MKKFKKSLYNFTITNAQNETLIMNMVTQKSLKVRNEDMKEFKAYLEGTVETVDPDLMDKLISKGIMIPDELDEAKRLIYKYNEMVYGTDALALTLVPTNDCNFRCKYCYEDHRNEYMDEKTEEKVLKFIEKKAKNCKEVRVEWFGGEALLCKEQVLRMSKRIAAICKENGVPLYGEMSTNGYELDVDTFKELIKYHIFEYQICIDGSKENHNASRPHVSDSNSYDRILNNLIKIRDEVKRGFFKILIRTNVTPGTEEMIRAHIDKMTDLFGNDNRFHMGFQCVRDWGGDNVKSEMIVDNEEKQYEKLYSYVREKDIHGASEMSFAPIRGNCAACRKNGYLIDYKGELHKCSMAYNNPQYADVDKIGYIKENGDYVIDEYKLSKWLVKPNYDYEKCQKCVLFPICMGGHCAFSDNIKQIKNCNLYQSSFLKEKIQEADERQMVEYWK